MTYIVGLDWFLHNLMIVNMAKKSKSENGTPKIQSKIIITT